MIYKIFTNYKTGIFDEFIFNVDRLKKSKSLACSDNIIIFFKHFQKRNRLISAKICRNYNCLLTLKISSFYQNLQNYQTIWLTEITIKRNFLDKTQCFLYNLLQYLFVLLLYGLVNIV